jgi:hypothetical protein
MVPLLRDRDPERLAISGDLTGVSGISACARNGGRTDRSREQ